MQIGDEVNYATTFNGVTLDNWKVFYVDGDRVYLIYGDYLSNSAIDTTTLTDIKKNGTTDVYANQNRKDFINAILNNSYWDSLLIGTLNGKNINLARSSSVYAIGSPDIDLWVNSWNLSYPSDTLYTAKTSSTMDDLLNGYYIGLSSNPTTKSIGLSSKTGYGNALYFPGASAGSDYGYWLASPSADNVSNMMCIEKKGNINYKTSTYTYCHKRLRPVICFPANLFAN